MSKLIDSIAANIFANGQQPVEAESISSNAFYCQLLVRWLSYPIYLNKQRLAKVSGCSLREIEELISARELPAYYPPGSKRAKYSVSDLVRAMERHMHK